MNKNLFPITFKLFGMIFSNKATSFYIKIMFKVLMKYLKHHGTIATVKLFKQIRLHVTRYLCGSPLKINSMMIGIDKDGWPKIISQMKVLADGNRQDKQLLLSLLFLSRTFIETNKDKLVPDYSSITDPRKTKKEYIIPSGYIKDWVLNNHLGINKIDFKDTDHFLSVKSSPTGPSTLTALWGIWNHSYDSLQSIFNITSESGIQNLQSMLNFSFNKNMEGEKKKNWSKNYLGNLSLIFDPECKVRIVAMLDYTTQLYLKPIHKALFVNLKKLNQDRTFTQDPFNKWLDNDESFWSIDLTSATDRFPISLQRRMISYMYGDHKFGSSWEYLLTNRVYARKGLPPVKYTVGQPMGAYSSWPAFTLSHHLVVSWSAHLCGLSNFKEYIILGDDIVIKNNIVAKKYMYVMSKLGVDLSPTKTHVSVNTYEFAKRWINNGLEISPLPMNGIVNNITNPYIVLMNLYDFFKIKRNSYTYSGGLLNLLEGLYRDTKLIKSNGKTYYLNLNKFKNLDSYLFALNDVFGYITYDQIRSYFVSKNHDLIIPGPAIIRNFMSHVASSGLSNLTMSSVTKSNGLVSRLTNSIGALKIDDPNDLVELPLFKGIYSYIQSLKDSVQKWNREEITLVQASRDLVQLDIDPIIRGTNRKTIELRTICKIYLEGLKNISSIDEIMYGTSSETVEDLKLQLPAGSNFVSSSALSLGVEKNIIFIENELKILATKKWQPPQTLQSIEDAYAA